MWKEAPTAQRAFWLNSRAGAAPSALRRSQRREMPLCRLLTFSEFHKSVYQQLPEAKDGSISETDYWGWTLPDRQKAVRKLFMNHGGQKLLSVTVGEPTKVLRLDGLKIHRDIPLTAEWLDEKTGKKNILSTRELLKAVVEIQGQYKLWNSNYE
jgi:hypothetical protein